MKNYIFFTSLITLLLLLTQGLTAQVSINTDNSLPDNSAMLDVKSTTKGMLAPRMTNAQMLAITSPATGLLVYNTTNQALYSFNGTSWTTSSSGIPTLIKDENGDTKVQTEKNSNEDIIRFDLGGTEKMTLIGNRLELLNPQSNTFIGGNAGQANAGGYWNVGVGNGTLTNNLGGWANTAIGQTCLNANSSGQCNTAIGSGAQYYNQTGSWNTALGAFSLFSNLSGTQNTALGSYALNANTGIYNTGVGADALKFNTTGYGNTAIGYQALQLNLDGSSNTAAGLGALTSNTHGVNNSALGYGALNYNSTGGENTAMGFHALYFNTQATGNTATGSNALYSNTLGTSNTANGWGALYSNTTAAQNIAIGNYALYTQSWDNGGTPYNTDNIAVGVFALSNNQPTSINNGHPNTAIGTSALQNNITGYENTAIGYGALIWNTTGYRNTAIGQYALKFNATGGYNTALGYFANGYSNDPQFNTTFLGYYSGGVINADNRVEIGNQYVSWIGGQVGWGTYSDGRIKDNIVEDVPGLSFINKLRPVTYNLNIRRQNSMVHKGKKDEGDWPSKYDIEKIKMTGFVAQEVEQAASEVGYNFSGVQKPAKENELYSLRYSDFVMPLVKAVQEQQVEIEKLTNNNNDLSSKVEMLLKRIEMLENGK